MPTNEQKAGAILGFLIVLCGAVLWFCGCGQPAKPVERPIVPATITVNIRPTICGSAAWSDAAIAAKLADLKAAHAQSGTRFNALPTITILKSEWVNAVITDGANARTPMADAMMAASKANFDRGEITIYLCETVQAGGQFVGGLAYLPPNHGIWISRSSCQNVFAHELGHCFALPHTDPLIGLGVACRVMSYVCKPSTDCSETFTTAEITTIRNAAMTWRKAACIIADGVAAKAKLVTPASDGGLIVCPSGN